MPHLVASVMGTTVTIDLRDDLPDALLVDALKELRVHDARFSTYRTDSEISRIDRGDLELAHAHADVREVLAACAVLRAESDGAFDAWHAGRLDPSGYVKGWAAERAADVLRSGGARNFALNLGGDIVCGGEREPGEPWRVGIRHPDDPARTIATIAVRDAAVATSGLYERGEHVRHARTGVVPTVWRSITVVAPDLSTADAIATCALARGTDGPEWAVRRFGCHVAAYGVDGRFFITLGFEALRIA